MNIKFIDYSGEYPNLCGGVLILEIDGVLYSFGEDPENRKDPEHEFDRFWRSGGNIDCEYDVVEDEWELSDDLPQFLQGHEEEIMVVMNKNVPYGCCGGCL